MDGPAPLQGSHAALPLVQVHGRPRKKGINPLIVIVLVLGVAAVGAALAGALGTWWYVHEVEGPAQSASTLPNFPTPPKRK